VQESRPFTNPLQMEDSAGYEKAKNTSDKLSKPIKKTRTKTKGRKCQMTVFEGLFKHK
jgi:hypothetical protein